MFLGNNLVFLRKHTGNWTQEKLAAQMGVSRQTISKWESGEATPDVGKLMELCDIFSCSMDELLRRDLSHRAYDRQPIQIRKVPGFRMAKYHMISPNAREDLITCMAAWAQRSGLAALPGHQPRLIGWKFPYISDEQKRRFGMHGYASAYVLPESFEPSCGGMEICVQPDACYAVMTIREPLGDSRDSMAEGYRAILEFLNGIGIKKLAGDSCLPAFHLVYQRDGTQYADLFVHCGNVPSAPTYTFF